MKTYSSLVFLLLLFNLSKAQETNFPTGLKKGDKAPLFKLQQADGSWFNVENELKKGPVVIVFYRGQWCPYCNKALSLLNDSLSLLTAKNVSVVAISPETLDNTKKTIAKSKVAFPVLHDSAMMVMKAYQVGFAVDTATVAKYKQYGIDFEKSNGSNGANLPVPATYLINKEGIITYVYFNTDYRKRVSVKELLEAL